MTLIALVPVLPCTAEMFAAQAPALWPRGPVTVASTLGGGVAFELLRQAGERVERLAR